GSPKRRIAVQDPLRRPLVQPLLPRTTGLRPPAAMADRRADLSAQRPAGTPGWPLRVFERVDERRGWRGVGIRGPRSEEPVRPGSSGLDLPSGGGRGAGFRRRRELEDGARA